MQIHDPPACCAAGLLRAYCVDGAFMAHDCINIEHSSHSNARQARFDAPTTSAVRHDCPVATAIRGSRLVFFRGAFLFLLIAADGVFSRAFILMINALLTCGSNLGLFLLVAFNTWHVHGFISFARFTACH